MRNLLIIEFSFFACSLIYGIDDKIIATTSAKNGILMVSLSIPNLFFGIFLGELPTIFPTFSLS